MYAVLNQAVYSHAGAGTTAQFYVRVVALRVLFRLTRRVHKSGRLPRMKERYCCEAFRGVIAGAREGIVERIAENTVHKPSRAALL